MTKFMLFFCLNVLVLVAMHIEALQINYTDIASKFFRMFSQYYENSLNLSSKSSGRTCIFFLFL